ncbi:hypothetical protein MferCBS31731_005829 [Microsporum ferrugineum]
MIQAGLFVLFILATAHATPIDGVELAVRSSSESQPETNDSKFVVCMKEKYPGYPNELVTDHMYLIHCGDVPEIIDDNNNGLTTRGIDIYGVTSYLKSQYDRLGLRDNSQGQAENWSESTFVECMKKKYPLFPYDKSVSHGDIQHCHATRLNQLHARSNDDSHNPVIDVFGTAVTFLNDCNERDLPKNFQQAADFRANARNICDHLVGDLVKNDPALYGDVLKNAYTKEVQTLYGHKDVVLAVTMSIFPQARAAFATINKAKEAYDAICMSAISIFGTKDEGCTSELNYLQGRRRTTTGVKDGFLDFLIGGVKQGLLTIDFSPAEDF